MYAAGWVLSLIHISFEACVNYEAELEYVYQFGEVAKYVAETYGNVDLDRIYATGHSQGAGWSYELASVQPELLAAILILSLIHISRANRSDWGTGNHGPSGATGTNGSSGSKWATGREWSY